MITGCYVLDLYCENEDSEKHRYSEFPHQYTGRTEGECKRDARKHGWLLTRNNRAFCPKCSGKTAKKTEHKEGIPLIVMAMMPVANKESAGDRHE